MKELAERNLNDLVNEDELVLLTGVGKRSQNRLFKQIDVLKKAGIHYWLRYDGSLATTWFHVHNAKPTENVQKLPRFHGIK